MAPAESLLVLDFGSQYTQLIARRLREMGVYCEILPCTTPDREIWARKPIGVILSGGPESVYGDGAPVAPDGVLAPPVPVLGVCYGMQLLARESGGGGGAAGAPAFLRSGGARTQRERAAFFGGSRTVPGLGEPR